LAIGAVLVAPLAASASPVVYSITTNGLDGGYICTGTTAANCGTTKTFQYEPPVPYGLDPATGTITLDSSAGTVAFSIDVASATFLDTAGADNGVDEIEFTDLHYAGTLTGATFAPFGSDTLISWAAQNTPTVSGDYEQLLSGGNVNGPDAFSKTARMSAGQCVLTAAGYLTCGFTLGPGGGPFALNVGADGDEETRRVVHTLNVVAVPEPGTAILLALGVAGIGVRRRTR
jgi:hypothetical protein